MKTKTNYGPPLWAKQTASVLIDGLLLLAIGLATDQIAHGHWIVFHAAMIALSLRVLIHRPIES